MKHSPYLKRPLRSEAEVLAERCPPHDWETVFGWGVIIGVAKCKKCGRISRSEDFPACGTGKRNEEAV